MLNGEQSEAIPTPAPASRALHQTARPSTAEVVAPPAPPPDTRQTPPGSSASALGQPRLHSGGYGRPHGTAASRSGIPPHVPESRAPAPAHAYPAASPP